MRDSTTNFERGGRTVHYHNNRVLTSINELENAVNTLTSVTEFLKAAGERYALTHNELVYIRHRLHDRLYAMKERMEKLYE